MQENLEKSTPRETLEMMLGHLGFVFEVEEENRLCGPTLHIRMRNPARLIGKEGRTLEDLQLLLNRILAAREAEAGEGGRHASVVIDVESYRMHQQDELLEKVREVVERVRSTGNEEELMPLNSFERRIVHLSFEHDPDIETISPEDKSRLKRIRVRKRIS